MAGQGALARGSDEGLGRRGRRARTTAPAIGASTAAFAQTRAKATGFFRVEQSRRPVVVRVPGRAPVLLDRRERRRHGVGHARAGREDLFAALPPASLGPGRPGARSAARSTPGTCSAASATTGGRNGPSSPPGAWPPGASTRCTTGARPSGQPSRKPRVPYALMMRGWQTGPHDHGHARRVRGGLRAPRGRSRRQPARRTLPTIRGCSATSSATSRPGRAAKASCATRLLAGPASEHAEARSRRIWPRATRRNGARRSSSPRFSVTWTRSTPPCAGTTPIT